MRPPQWATAGWALRTVFSSLTTQLLCSASGIGLEQIARAVRGHGVERRFGGQHADFIAVWLPLIRGTLTKPAEQPINAPPGNTSLGIAC